MNIYSVGFSCGDDYDGKESKVGYIDERSCRETKQRDSSSTTTRMDQMQHGDDDDEDDGHEVVQVVDFEIWPVEHPSEPPDEDRPVKCPMPADSSSVINLISACSEIYENEMENLKEGGKREKRFGERTMRKRPEVKKLQGGNGMEEEEEAMTSEPPPVRAVRKRHHTLTHGGSDARSSGVGGDDQIIMPLSRMPPLPPLPNHSITIFQMLQQIDKFDS
ncbi:hypothetical protein FNV43_RR26787 [Rhamnella rubrinervis]|uniref:Uncharacterized protein n=1 Tax=Rhamnella rubrinervis TaxID=2594499 RepID=A0A8K0DPY7_9ROSA|nr:hypothetical protein FNV43_RR26787 [Rhamnella rubrinervis]